MLKFGVGFLLVGSAMLYTLWASNLADYMLLEDLALEYSPAAKALASVSPGERIVLNGSLVLIFIGVALAATSGIARLRRNRNH